MSTYRDPIVSDMPMMNRFMLLPEGGKMETTTYVCDEQNTETRLILVSGQVQSLFETLQSSGSVVISVRVRRSQPRGAPNQVRPEVIRMSSYRSM